MKYIRLGDLLVKSGTITQEKLDEALKLYALHCMERDVEAGRARDAAAERGR